MMTYKATKREVANRGIAPDAFLSEMIAWAKAAPDEIFTPRTAPKGKPDPDIYAKVKPELGPYVSLIHRKAVMLEVMRVLAGFESSWDWAEGVDTSRMGDNTPANSEAGAWQVSYDARKLSAEVRTVIEGIDNGAQFQRAMKFNHPLAMEFVARLMRNNTRHNGPLYKGDERAAIRKSLRGEKHSIYPWLQRDAVEEFASAL